tara:strand:+ start:255 stop:1295 length:1041 start_codon:yes stop_codon:yes gene_type:complete
MKIAIITDQHFGARKGSKEFHAYFKKFYDNVFFPYLEEHKIDTVIDMGDTFDNRRSIDLWSIDWAKETYFDRLQEMGVTLHSIVGNHTAYYKDTNEVNTIDLLLKEYKNITTYSETTSIEVGGLNILLVPWINEENKEMSLGLIKKSKAPVAMGHLELNGFVATAGHVMDHGMDTTPFKKFNRVYSGHYHTRSNVDNIYYLGNPYEMFWNDVNDSRGFHIFDTETLEHTPVNNPYRLFYKIFYEDTNYKLFNSKEYKNKIVKVIVKKKTNQKQFEKFIDKLYSTGIQDLKIIENFDIQESQEFEVEESENTIGILNRYIDEAEFEGDKTIIKGILQKIYAEACEVD